MVFFGLAVVFELAGRRAGRATPNRLRRPAAPAAPVWYLPTRTNDEAKYGIVVRRANISKKMKTTRLGHKW